MSLALGIDIGTTATKAVVIDGDGGVVAEAERRSELLSPHPGWAEEDTELWWRNVCSLRDELPLGEVATVGVSGMVPCVILLDAAGRALRPSIQQNDARAVHEVERVRERLAGADVLQRTGSPVTQQSVAPTAVWLRRHEPDTWAAAQTILGSYDYIAFRLTGERGVERNWALESGLLDLKVGAWGADLCAAGEIDASLLPPVRTPSEVVGQVTAEAAAATGIRHGAAVVGGSADHVASAFAAGLVANGDLLVKLGGAGDILLFTDSALVDERLYLDFHLIPGKFLPNGCMAASGSLIRWFQRELAGGAPLAELDAEAAAVGVGAGGIVALPYMLGEKTPINDPRARGALVGLHLGHGRGHLFRAVLEAIAFGFRHHVDVFAERGFQPGRVRVTNGGAKSELWRQVTADVLGRELELPRGTGGSAFGAAFAAGMGAGMFRDWSEIERFLTVDRTVEPHPTAHGRYDELYRLYREIYPALRPIFHAESEWAEAVAA
jgi:xylulokinase